MSAELAEQAAQNVTTAEAEQSAQAGVKVTKEKPCYCQAFEVRGETEDEVFSTGCQQTTKATFAQGHDARLVSFLVDAHFDKYKLFTVIDGTDTSYPTPADAAGTASDALRSKAEKATANRQAKIEAKASAAAEREAKKAQRKAEKEAAKAAGPKATGAEVTAGSSEGDQPELAVNEAIIKVGRFEYRATVERSTVEGEADTYTYTDGKGEVQTRTDGVKVLRSGATEAELRG